LRVTPADRSPSRRQGSGERLLADAQPLLARGL
jgi:hypothetical protein